jgi:hypothetical protein
MERDDLLLTTTLADKSWITSTTDLHGVRSNCKPAACTVRARPFGRRSVANRQTNVERIGKKPSKPSKASKTPIQREFLVAARVVLSRPQAVQQTR